MKADDSWPRGDRREFTMGPSKLGPRPLTPKELQEQADAFVLMVQEAADDYNGLTIHYEIPEFHGNVWKLVSACGANRVQSTILKLTTNPKRITCRRCVSALTRKR